MKRINVLCAMRDSRVVEGLRRDLDDRCLFRVVGSGDAVLACAKRMPPDILVVDAVLPRLDGIGVIQQLRSLFGDRMPLIIGGSVQRFADAAFARLGVSHLTNVPWERQALGGMLRSMIDWMDTLIDWESAQNGYRCAQQILRSMGMNERLHGFGYLAWASALASQNEERLYAIGQRLYAPIALREHTTVQNVERLIRHAVERTADTVGEHGIYAFFGNTIDPMRGKPTNAQMISVVAQRIRHMEERNGV